LYEQREPGDRGNVTTLTYFSKSFSSKM
jgi:hypothetical protein